MEELKNLDGWEIVDSMDGRRWLGEVESRNERGPYEIVRFKRAVQFIDSVPGVVLVPNVAPNARSLIGGRAEPEMSLEARWMLSDGSMLVTPCAMPFMPPWSVWSTGGVRIADLPGHYRDSLIKVVQKIIKAEHDRERTRAQ